MTVVLGLADIYTGPAIALSVFYLVPVSLAAWFGNRKAGITVSLLASAIIVARDLSAAFAMVESLAGAWNGFSHLGFFLSTTYLVSELKSLLEAEKLLARTDHLTSVMNRRAFIEQFEVSLHLARRRSSPLTIAYIDLDDFKQTNDRYGHEVGDQVLKSVAMALKNHCRRTDLVARIGGDEFVLVLPDTEQQSAQPLLTKIHKVVREITVRSKPVACSAGVVTFARMPMSAEEALRIADSLMYQVKEQGKNKVAFSVFDNYASNPGHPSS